MVWWNYTKFMALVSPCGMALMNRDNTRLKVMSTAEVFVKSKTYNSRVCLHIDTLRFCCTLLCHLNHLGSLIVYSTYSANTSQHGGAIHSPTKDMEEDEQQDEAEEHDTHTHECHSDAMRIFLLKLLYFFVLKHNIGRVWSYLIFLKYLPFRIIDASIA